MGCGNIDLNRQFFSLTTTHCRNCPSLHLSFSLSAVCVKKDNKLLSHPGPDREEGVRGVRAGAFDETCYLQQNSTCASLFLLIVITLKYVRKVHSNTIEEDERTFRWFSIGFGRSNDKFKSSTTDGLAPLLCSSITMIEKQENFVLNCWFDRWSRHQIRHRENNGRRHLF